MTIEKRERRKEAVKWVSYCPLDDRIIEEFTITDGRNPAVGKCRIHGRRDPITGLNIPDETIPSHNYSVKKA